MFFFSSRRRHTRLQGDWSSDVCSSDLVVDAVFALGGEDDLVRLLARVEAVQSFLTTDAGKNLLTAYGRAANIVRAEEKKDKALSAKIAGAPNAALLEQTEEKAVASALADVEKAVRPAL